jgi:FkbM family methyltransferase
VRAALRAWLRPSPPKVSWAPAPSITRQCVEFVWRQRALRAEADFKTPLYETVAELVDYDSYQLAGLPWPSAPFHVLDIGANIGVAALLFASVPGATVTCFEPLRENCERLRANVALNGLKPVTVVEAAIGRADGESAFQAHASISVAGRLGGRKQAGEWRSTTVRTVSLRTALAACEGEIFLIKSDCEGGEYDILDQLTPDLAMRVRHMTFEIHDVDERRNLVAARRKMESLGFALAYKPDVHGRPELHHLLATRSR